MGTDGKAEMMEKPSDAPTLDELIYVMSKYRNLTAKEHEAILASLRELAAARRELSYAEMAAEAEAKGADEFKRERDAARERIAAIQAVVNEQAESDGCWFVAKYATEAYLQQELRRLHAVIEGTGDAKSHYRERIAALEGEQEAAVDLEAIGWALRKLYAFGVGKVKLEDAMMLDRLEGMLRDAALGPEPREKTRSERRREAGFTPRPRAIPREDDEQEPRE